MSALHTSSGRNAERAHGFDRTGAVRRDLHPRERNILDQKHIAVFVNPASTNAQADLDAGFALLREAGFSLSMETVDDPANLADAIREHPAEIVMVGGGDGTTSCAAGVLANTDRVLAVLPLGNACDFARSLGIPRDPLEACRVVVEGRIHAVDVARVNGHTYLNMASLGLSVDVARRMSGEFKRRWGVFGYPKLLWDAARAARSFHVTIDCDGNTVERRVIQIGVGNGYHYGGGMTVADDARLDDGLLHVHAIHPLPWWQLLLLFPYLWAGRVREPERVIAMTGAKVKVTTHHERTVNADGEMANKTPATFEVDPGALKVCIPAEGPIPGLGV